MSYENEVYLGLRVATVERDENALAIIVPSPVSKAPMATVPILCRSYMTIQVFYDNYCIFQSVCREKVKTSFCASDDDLHETVIEPLHLAYRVPEALRDDYAYIVCDLWATAVHNLEAVPYVL
ncbi:hypothetical protein Y032_0071g587 [Ancylostoma ceylanicum]|uniref:Uncharacterized protein n=1 Tax=Ancylostoma ceylanicum TaxID=53326 RepID=A0A016TXF9_9BILA|nr:hypothetical protein Y032_0071g587 [Ancylostoma ceylanicum]